MDRAVVERIEGELTPGELAIVREWCSRMWADAETWPEYAPLSPLVDLAVSRCCDRLRQTGAARSDTHALQLAAPRFGLDPETLRKRWQRYRNAA